MKVKEIERTANIAWSPSDQFPIYMVAGTAAQQLDATFSTSAALEVYQLNLTDSSLSMPVVATVPADCRFHKIVWGSHGMTDSSAVSGIVVAGADNGSIYCYDGAGLIKGSSSSLRFKKEKHTGAVKALDFNKFQKNLLASGASESEIYIWDMNKPESPMTPGAKSQPPEEVACIAWNCQVQHIIASTFTSKCVVWDLRKNEPIIKVSDSMSRIKCKMVSWHPDVATQMCLSSEDDHTPVIQLWDLRYATSPVKVLENHQRGVLDIAWCPQDPDLLLSCGKDNRILCWNPNSNVQGGEVVYELPTSNQWCFDVKWCPRNPCIISSCSFDGHVTCYSLMGGGHPIHHADKVADAFQSNDPFQQAAAAHAAAQMSQNVMPLQKPPKWLMKPVGASFGFGGKMVSFDHEKSANPQQPSPRQVYISQVVTETELLQRSSQLEQALYNGQYVEYCAMKAANSTDPLQENIWNFLRVNFEKEPRDHYIQLLGYDKTELVKKVSEHVGSGRGHGVDAKELAQKMSQLNTSGGLTAPSAGSGQASPSVGSKTPGSRDEISLGSSAFDEIAASSLKQQEEDEASPTPLVIPTKSDADGLLSQALLTGNFEAAVDICLCENMMAEAILLSIAGGPELLSRTQKKYFQINKSHVGRLISSVVTHEWSHIVETCELANWKEALAVILTYASPDEFASLCDTLALRLESEGEFSVYASLCYICSGNVEKLVENWHKNTESGNSPLALQDLVEKVMVLRQAVELSRGRSMDVGSGHLAEKLNNYANMLAAQGSLDTAIRYLGNSTEISLAVLKDRLYHALGNVQGLQAPQSPFQKQNVLPQGARQPQQKQQQPQQPRSAVRQPGQSVSAHQATAQGSFGTVTTPSVSYMNSTNYSVPYSQMNGSTALPSQAHTGQHNLYNPALSAPAVSASTSMPGAVSKGPLSHKYPSHPATQPSYGMDSYGHSNVQSPYGTNQPGYDQTQNYYGVVGASSQVSHDNLYNPGTPGGPSQPSRGSGLPHMESFMDHKPNTGWNDPPMVKDRKPKTPTTQYESSSNTNPMFGASVPSQDPPGAPMNYAGLYNPQEHHAAIQQAEVAASRPEPPKPVEKGPIPQEHQVLQDIFGSLVKNCTSVASNAQMKRKLDEVSRKLELLYDRLRQNNLSQSVILGLHQIVQAIQQYDYNTGLHIYTQMVSQGNFSEISGFMPGLKMLIQTAMQMNVYVQAS
ncbi:hypothetical protein FSP39_007256 [Pinctada imbricata]|uniref:Protein transport protein Sec31A n=1 Tax=Pinctada imbricata TaxID=66713 RepID=A0AA89BNV6_PINIB|nr:hypothetical protein FSP39_007256 [Pinctada imbricata]